MTTEIKRGYHDNGDIHSETLYVGGKRHGVERWYDTKGNLIWLTPYIDGQLINDPDFLVTWDEVEE